MKKLNKLIKNIPMVCFLLWLPFVSPSHATDIRVNQFYFTQLNECQYTFYGYFMNYEMTDYVGPVNISTQLQDNKFQYFFGDVTLKSGDSIRFWFTANLCSNDAKVLFMNRPLTNKDLVQRGPGGNGGDFSAVNACIWIEENSNLANKVCDVSIPHLKFNETVRIQGKRKSKDNLNENNPDKFDENVDLSFNIFPNPIVNITYLLMNSLSNRDISLQILNNTGQIVKQIDKSIPSGAEFIEVDMNDLGPGVYYFRILGASTLVSNTVFKMY